MPKIPVLSSLHFAVPASQQHQLWAIGCTACEGKRHQLRLQVVPQHDVDVGLRRRCSLAGSGSSRTCRMRRTTTTAHLRGDTEGDNVQFRRSPLWLTPRCPLSSTIPATNVGDLATHVGRPSGRGTRGERRPLRRGTAPEHGRRRSLRGRRSPLVDVRHRRSEVASMLAPTRDRTGVLDRVKVPRASRAAANLICRDLDPACARPGMATVGASGIPIDVNTNRTRGRP